MLAIAMTFTQNAKTPFDFLLWTHKKDFKEYSHSYFPYNNQFLKVLQYFPHYTVLIFSHKKIIFVLNVSHFTKKETDRHYEQDMLCQDVARLN